MSLDSQNNLSVAQAANRLQDALRALEGALNPMADRLKVLEAETEDNEVLEADRARLAGELDAAKALAGDVSAKEAEWAQKEKEFSALAGETMAELDAVIRRVQQTLGGGGGA